jgi:hypothetical protein
MRTIEKVGYGVAGVLFASGLVHLGVLVFSGSTWLGPVSFRKPTTFGVSFGLTVGAAVWASGFLRVSERVRAVLLGVLMAASTVEVSLITTQAWRHVPSHFNFETPFDSTVSMTLAGGGFVLIVVIAGFTLAAFRTVYTPTMQLALRFGFSALMVSLAVGAVMIAKGVIEVRTGHPDIAYATAGVLKPAHAVPMHAILIMPGLSWLLSRTSWTEHRQLSLMRSAAAAYAVLIVGTIIYFA